MSLLLSLPSPEGTATPTPSVRHIGPPSDGKKLNWVRIGPAPLLLPPPPPYPNSSSPLVALTRTEKIVGYRLGLRLLLPPPSPLFALHGTGENYLDTVLGLRLSPRFSLSLVWGKNLDTDLGLRLPPPLPSAFRRLECSFPPMVRGTNRTQVAVESVRVHPSMAAQCGYGGGSVKRKREEGRKNLIKTTITKSFFFTSICTRKRLAAELHPTHLGSLKRSIILLSAIVGHTL